MKRCPQCGQTYTDENINFCLNDGELLSRQTSSSGYQPPFGDSSPVSAADDSPPTMVLDKARITNPVGWSASSQPPAQWQQQQPQQQKGFYPYMVAPSPDQTLPIVSLAAGVASLTIGWCCSAGLLLGPAAMITGFIALSQNKKDPEHYGGRALAIGGIAAGGIFLAVYIVIMLIYLAASILPNL
jgi:hypothetical protein